MAAVPYTLDAAARDIAALRGQVDRLTEVLTFLDSASPGPNNPAAGSILYSLGGDVKYASPDGNDYNTGQLIAWTTGTQAISSTTPATITGLTAPVGPGTYGFTVILPLSGTAGTNSPQVKFTGPASSFFQAYSVMWGGSMTGFVTGNIPINTATTVGSALGGGNNYLIRINGIMTFTATGTFAVQAAGQSYTLQAGGLLYLNPSS